MSKRLFLSVALIIIAYANVVAQCAGVIAVTGTQEVTNATCGNTGRALLTVKGGIPPYTITISGGTLPVPQVFTLTSAPYTVTTPPLPAGNYSVVYDDNSSCPGTISNQAFTITNQRAEPIITPSATEFNCRTNSITMIVSNISSGPWSWDNGTTTNPRTVTAEGTYVVTATNTSSGCTGTAAVTLLRTSADSTVTVNRSICAGSCTEVAGEQFCNPGTFTKVVTNNVTGCKKTYNITIVQVAQLVENRTQTFCEGQTITFNGITISNSGFFRDTVPDQSGCDKIINLTAIRIPTKQVAQTVRLCSGDSIAVGVNTYNTAGVYIDKLAAFGTGCDSVVTTTVIIKPKYTGNDKIKLTRSICGGGSVTIGAGTTAVTYNTTGIFNTTLQTREGCDSIVELDLTVRPSFNINNTDTLKIQKCTGGSYTFDGVNYTTNQNIRKQFATFKYGCDSVVILDLKFVDTIRPALQLIRKCEGDSFTFKDSTFIKAGFKRYKVLGISGECDSIYTFNLQFGRTATVNIDTTICKGASITVAGTVYNTSGTYTDIIKTAGFLCDSTIITKLTVIDISLSPTTNYALCNGIFSGNIVVVPSGGATPYVYDWGAGVPQQPFRSCLSTGQYTVTVSDANRCTLIKTFDVFTEDPNDCIALNEGFTPDGDIHNETWRIPCIEDVDNVVQVYNRWGQLLFESKNYQGDWNGTVNGKGLPDGVYYYVINTNKRLWRGQVVILRQ